MGPGVSLRQLLSSLCHGTAWAYAVFWKITHQDYPVLAWEDGYFETADSAGNAFSNEIFAGTSQIISFGCEVGMPSRRSPGCLVEQAITKMSSHLYTSDGIVGLAALSGEHCWIFGDPRSLHEYPEEWQFQIVAGIKTILLVPVQHGVVQLGSLESVEENLCLVSNIRHLFSSFQGTSDTCAQLVSNGNMATTPSCHSASLVTKGSLPNQQQSYPQKKKHRLGADVEYVTRKEQCEIDYHSSPYIMQGDLTLPQTDMEHMINSEATLEETFWNPKFDSCSVFASQDLRILDPYSGTDNPILIESQSSSFAPESILLPPHRNEPSSFANTELQHEKYGNCFANTELQHEKYGNCFANTEPQHEKYGNYGAEDEIRWSQKTETSDMFHDSIGVMVNSSPGLKLHDTSGLPFSDGISDCFLSSAFWGDGVGNSMVYSQTQDNNLKPFSADFSEIITDKSEEQLIDAVVHQPHCSADENSENLSRRPRSSSNSSGDHGGSCITQNRPENMADHLDSREHIKSRFAFEAEAFASSPTRSCGKSGSLSSDELKNTKVPRSGNASIKKSSHIGKKKRKADDTLKPRPRDRQLIQDRVKELRELVPQGEKCSIDALLDRAIKHMLFLRSVSVQAEKLKDCAHPKVPDVENKESTESQSDHNGATWAYELGSKTETCPILVENLEQPGHILVEMLCTEYADFLEIAHVIRHSELVILKGVMENRSDKLWARFIVEASRGFDRTDILWPLMRLLQQTRGSFTASV